MGKNPGKLTQHSGVDNAQLVNAVTQYRHDACTAVVGQQASGAVEVERQGNLQLSKITNHACLSHVSGPTDRPLSSQAHHTLWLQLPNNEQPESC